MENRIFIILAFLVTISMGSCISKKKLVYTKYYLLEPPLGMTITAAGYPRSNINLEISSVRIGPAYGGTKIVNRYRSNEIVYFNYHEWAVLPHVSITEFATKFLKSTQYYKDVSSRISGDQPIFRIEMEVSRMEMLNLTDDTQAHVVVSYKYIDAATGRVVVQHNFDQNTVMPERDVNLLAETLSDLIWESLDQVFSKIVDYHNSAG